MDRTKKKKNNLLQSDWKFEISIQEINVKKKITRNVVINVTMTKSMPSFCVLSLSS
jgi:hypothetical protein